MVHIYSKVWSERLFVEREDGPGSCWRTDQVAVGRWRLVSTDWPQAAPAVSSGEKKKYSVVGKDDDNGRRDVWDDEFSSWGRLDLSAVNVRKREGTGQGLDRGGKEKWALEKKKKVN